MSFPDAKEVKRVSQEAQVAALRKRQEEQTAALQLRNQTMEAIANRTFTVLHTYFKKQIPVAAAAGSLEATYSVTFHLVTNDGYVGAVDTQGLRFEEFWNAHVEGAEMFERTVSPLGYTLKVDRESTGYSGEDSRTFIVTVSWE